MASRRRVSALIRRAGVPFALLQDGVEVTRFNAVLNSANGCLSVAELPLEIGAIVHPLSSPRSLYIVTDTNLVTYYEDHTVKKLKLSGTVSRFSADSTARDTFGRPVSPDPVTIYTEVPLCLLPKLTSTDDTTADRSTAKSEYEFITSDSFVILPKDRLVVGALSLVITAPILAPSGLCSFRAEAIQ